LDTRAEFHRISDSFLKIIHARLFLQLLPIAHSHADMVLTIPNYGSALQSKNMLFVVVSANKSDGRGVSPVSFDDLIYSSASYFFYW